MYLIPLLTILAAVGTLVAIFSILWLLIETDKTKNETKAAFICIAVEALLITLLCSAWNSFNSTTPKIEYIPIETKGNLTYYCYNDKIIQLTGDQGKTDVNKYVMKITTYPAGYHYGMWFGEWPEITITEKPKSLESP